MSAELSHVAAGLPQMSTGMSAGMPPVSVGPPLRPDGVSACIQQRSSGVSASMSQVPGIVQWLPIGGWQQTHRRTRSQIAGIGNERVKALSTVTPTLAQERRGAGGVNSMGMMNDVTATFY